MKTKRCGKYDLQLPVLGIGCWSFGGGEYWGQQDQADVDSVVAAALEQGCTYFDTAEVYNEGRSELSLGAALRGKRHKAIIGSKVSPDHLYPAVLRSHCEASLRRLKTDYLDLYMIHWPVNPVSLRHYTSNEDLIRNPPGIGEAFEILRDLQDEGKIRCLGVSNFGVEQLKEIGGYDIVVDQLCYNLVSRAIEIEIIPYCGERGIGIIGYMPLMQGILTGKYATLDEIPWQRARTRHFSGNRRGSRHGEPGFERLLGGIVNGIRAVEAQTGIPMRTLALAWSIARDPITCMINGVRNLDQLMDNISSVTVELDSEIISRLDSLTAPLLAAMGPNADPYEGSEESRIR